VVAAAAIESLMTREMLRQEQSHIEMLLETTKALRSAADVKGAFPAVANAVGKVLSPALIGLTVYDRSTDSFHLHSIEPPEFRSLFSPEAIVPFEQTLTATVLAEGKARIMVREEILKLSSTHAPRLLEHGIEAICSLPLITAGRKLGALNLGSRSRDSFSDRSVTALEQIAGQIAIALDRARAEREIAELTRRLKTQNIHEIANSRSQPGFSEIIGESSALKVVLNHVATVAPTDSTVLILGETGTGKELIARALHRLSSRRDGSFVKLNCAAIPTGLLESELFGHEKGAFTSAVSQKIGRLEMAHKGTLLLDEVGDIPTELQPKLLRVLQDQEFERLGGTRTIRVDVRLIAATNKDLARSVMANEFRSDLYYRLNVFPVTCPALRDRPDDIPFLVRHFVEKYATRMHKQIDHILADTMLALKNWRWPGNVRELENFIERSVILSDGDTLKPPLAELQSGGESFVEGTLASAEREHILHALRQSGGVISGAQGAAAHLGLKRTTLQSRMQKLGIDRHDYRN
jgi:formate hydrogenlyase transcriptional activator